MTETDRRWAFPLDREYKAMSSFSWTWHEGSASSIRRGYGANWNDYPAVKVDVVSVPWTPGWRPGNCLSGRPATVLVSGSQSSLPAAALGAISVADCVPPQRAHEYSSLKVHLPTRPVLSKTRGKPATGLLPIELPIIGPRGPANSDIVRHRCPFAAPTRPEPEKPRSGRQRRPAIPGHFQARRFAGIRADAN